MRIGIFVIYDRHGQVEEYVLYVLKALRQVVDRLAVVCNIEWKTDVYEQLEPYADDIYFRENKGYDAGGIKDALCQYIGWEKLGTYDELLITNDSYFGPFVPFENIFSKMEQAEADFWGLIKYEDDIYPEHVQSFFLNIRSKMMHSLDFREFWERLEYPTSFMQAVWEYEVEFTKFFEARGYKSLAWNLLTEGYSCEYNRTNSSIWYAGDLVVKYGFPVLKKKAFVLPNIEQVIKVIDYLKRTENYPIELIAKYFLQHPQHDGLFPFKQDINTFIESHNHIYLYGNGENGKHLRKYFDFRHIHYDGVLVTINKDGEDTIEFTRELIDEEDGIIVTVTKMPAHKEIVDLLLQSGISREQLYLPL